MKRMSCRVPPRGWSCSRSIDHAGPCAAGRDAKLPLWFMIMCWILGACGQGAVSPPAQVGEISQGVHMIADEQCLSDGSSVPSGWQTVPARSTMCSDLKDFGHVDADRYVQM